MKVFVTLSVLSLLSAGISAIPVDIQARDAKVASNVLAARGERPAALLARDNLLEKRVKRKKEDSPGTDAGPAKEAKTEGDNAGGGDAAGSGSGQPSGSGSGSGSGAPAPASAPKPDPAKVSGDKETHVFERVSGKIPEQTDPATGQTVQGFAGRDGRDHSKLNNLMQDIGGQHKDVVTTNEHQGKTNVKQTGLGVDQPAREALQNDGMKGAPTKVYQEPYKPEEPETLVYKGSTERKWPNKEIKDKAQEINTDPETGENKPYDPETNNCNTNAEGVMDAMDPKERVKRGC